MLGLRMGLPVEGVIGGQAAPLVLPAYVASQSSVHASKLGTYENLTDGNGLTGAGTGLGIDQFIKATFPAPVAVSAVILGGGSLAGWDTDIATYLNGSTFQYSGNDTTWTTLFTVTGVTNSGASQFKQFSFSPVTARYFRLLKQSWLACTEMRFVA